MLGNNVYYIIRMIYLSLFLPRSPTEVLDLESFSLDFHPLHCKKLIIRVRILLLLINFILNTYSDQLFLFIWFI